MFPTLSHVFDYLFGINFPYPIPTFGVFVALAFILSYLTFSSELKRKEKEGLIHSFNQVLNRKGATFLDYFEFGLLGFLLGYKVIGAFYYKELFWKSPLSFIFSLKGTWMVGIALALLLMYLIYRHRKQEINENPKLKTVRVHPYQMMPKMVIWAAVWGFIGAKLFNFFENYQLYSTYSLSEYFKYSGLTFLGGLTIGGMGFLYVGKRCGIKFIHLFDIGSPGMLVAYGVGRIGCQLSGDGDWGVMNTTVNPFQWLPDWMWSFSFPYNVLNEGQYIRGCVGPYCNVLRNPVFPTSFYESVLILGAFSIIWAFRRKIKLPGMMFSIYLVVVGAERLFIEEIRVNLRHHFLGLNLSQAQIVSLIFIAAGLILGTYTWLNRKELRPLNR